MPYGNYEKQKSYCREWIAARRKAWLKANGPCVRCGSRKKLTVDHRDPSTKVTHRIWSWSKKRREKELDKCQALCDVCHKEKSGNERATPIRHGTTTGYRRSCRCRPCVDAKLKYNQIYKSLGPVTGN